MLTPTLAAQTAVVETEHLRAELIAYAPDGVKPGAKLQLGLQFKHQPHWHSYWKNPGDSGLPTSLRWELPSGWTPGEIDWPTPSAFVLDPLVNFGFDGEVLLPVAVELPGEVSGDSFDVKLRARWLVCEEICVPESGQFLLRLSAEPALSHKASFDAAAARRPMTSPSEIVADLDGEFLNVVAAELPQSWRGQSLQSFPEVGGVFEHAAKLDQSWRGGSWVAKLPLSVQRSDNPDSFYLVLKLAESSESVRLKVRVPAWMQKPA